MDLHPEDRVPVTIPVQGPSGATYLVRFGQGDWNAATLTDGKIEVVIKGPDFTGDSEGIEVPLGNSAVYVRAVQSPLSLTAKADEYPAGFIHCARY